ncbi:MAG: beta-ketoacyl-ACP synthase II [Planctomycetota bacterium]
MSNRKRVVITGMGAVTNVGVDVASMWSSILAGRSGISSITQFGQGEDWAVTIAGEVSDWDPEALLGRREARRLDRFALLGLQAADEAARDSGIDFTAGDPYRRGVVVGSGVGGIRTIEIALEKLVQTGPAKISPFTVPKLMVNAAAGMISIRFDLRGANSSMATACATGGHAIGNAFHLIQRGDADVIMAGGCEAAVTALCISSFASMKALSTRNHDPERASRPFDRDRDGFVLSEGAAILVLEELEHARARGATIHGEVLGFGTSGDAQHIAAPDPAGLGAQHSMRSAIADAGINLEDVDYINAHGTSTPLGDAAEVAAVKALFGDHAHKLSMSSTKSMTGHTLGAAGGIESVISALAVKEDIVPATINLDNPDDGFDIDLVPNEAKQRPVRYALNNSFGFGGHNVTVIFGKAP